MKIIFWQKSLSIHQAAFMRHLSSLIFVTVNVSEAISSRRLALGWKQADYGKSEIKIFPNGFSTEEHTQNLIDNNIVHIVSGLKGSKFTTEALVYLIKKEQTIVILSEPYRNDDYKYPVRFLKALMDVRKYDKAVKFYLPIGNLADKQFRALGISKQKLYPFGYFLEAASITQNVVTATRNKTFQLIFAGALIKRKGLDILLKALHILKEKDFHLTIVGNGAEEEKLKAESEDYGINTRITWKKVLENDAVKQLTAQSDFLILPSSFDGWGAVVSEAFMAGTPVICSDNCGSSVLVSSSGYGQVFKAGKVNDLARALTQMFEAGKTTDILRSEIKQWAEKNIHPIIAAEYLMKIINFETEKSVVRPVAPWTQKALIENTRNRSH